jgi:hypothetical protein
VAVAEALETVAHDRLTRMWPGHWSGQTRLERAFHTLFVWERGSLLLDDTVLPTPFATAIEGLAWVFSSQERQPVDGLSLVLLVWTTGRLRMPRGMRLWRKGGPATDDLALERRRDARNRLRCPPGDGISDAWSPSRALLKRMRDEGWDCVCRLQKTRRFNARPLRVYRRHPSWAERGWLSGGLNVLVGRHGKKSYAPNRLPRAAAAVRPLDRVRSHIEEIISGCQDQLGLSGCQARAERAQLHHVTGCLVAFCVLERERQARQLSSDKLQRQLRFRGRTLTFPTRARLRGTA